MKHITILVPKGQFSVVNIAGAYQMLQWANDAFSQQTRKRLFEIEFVGYEQPANDNDGFYTINPTKTISDVEKTDLIIVPAVHGDLEQAAEVNAEVIHWIAKQYAQGAEVAAFCIGVFLLAEAGLLNGKVCSTHWGYAEVLQSKYPEVEVRSEKIVAECNGVYTSGGAYAFTNLVIYLIEKYGGRELAVMTAKAFMIDMDKSNQSLFMIFNGQKDHGDDLVLSLQNELEQNYQDHITVHELADKHATNRRTLERRFKNATGNTIIEYLQRVRIESAKKTLETPEKSVADAMYNSGYSDSKAFREVFKKHLGLSPADYKKKFTRSTEELVSV